MCGLSAVTSISDELISCSITCGEIKIRQCIKKGQSGHFFDNQVRYAGYSEMNIVDSRRRQTEIRDLLMTFGNLLYPQWLESGKS